MLQAVRGRRQGMTEGLPDQAQVALVAGMVVLGALVLATSGGLGFFWWRYQQSAKTLTIVAKSINNHSRARSRRRSSGAPRTTTWARGSAAS